MALQHDNWRPISEPIILPVDGGEVFWIEDGDRYLIISDPGPDSDISCFSAFYNPAVSDIRHRHFTIRGQGRRRR